MKCTSQKKLLKNLAVSDFESFYAPEETVEDTRITACTENFIPISISFSSNSVEKPINHFSFAILILITSLHLFFGPLETLAPRTKTQPQLLVPHSERSMNRKLGSTLENLSQRLKQREQLKRCKTSQLDYEQKNCFSAWFLRKRKNRLVDLQKSLERNCNVYLSSASMVQNTISNYSNPICYPTLLLNKILNKLLSKELTISSLSSLVNFSVQICWIFMTERFFDAFLKACKTSETKKFFPVRMVCSTGQSANIKTTPFYAFYGNLRNRNTFGADFFDYVKPVRSRMTTEQAVIRLKLSKSPLNGFENYQDLQEKETGTSDLFKDFLRWHSSIGHVPAFESRMWD